MRKKPMGKVVEYLAQPVLGLHEPTQALDLFAKKLKRCLGFQKELSNYVVLTEGHYVGTQK
jgi:hypothetical protein